MLTLGMMLWVMYVCVCFMLACTCDNNDVGGAYVKVVVDENCKLKQQLAGVYACVDVCMHA
jgi:hypothetical protein